MEHREGFFAGVRGQRLYHQTWLPEGEVRAVLFVVHGLAEHSGRYMNLVNRFVPKGYAVYGIDHIGHGRSEGPRLYVERFADYTEPLQTFFDMIRGGQPGRPVFLVGHSMGGLIGALYLLDHQDELAGAVLSGPAIQVSENVPPAVVFIGRLLSALIPRMGLIPLHAEGICRDPGVLEAYLVDPLVCKGKITARLGAEMLGAMASIRQDAGRIRLPLLIVQGGADKLVDPAGAKRFYDAAASGDKRLIVYEGFYHEVFNEPEHDRVLTDVETWLEVHLARRS
jgi:acylglycerol lipase